MADPVRLCFVCLGNICRSPTAEGVMRHLVAEAGLTDRIDIDSAGTAGWHEGDRPDRRALAEAQRRGLDLSDLRGRRFRAGDFGRFDLVLAMDHENEVDLAELAPDDAARASIALLRTFDPTAGPDADLAVPDPWYGGEDGFAAVFDMVERACRGLLDHVRAELLDPRV